MDYIPNKEAEKRDWLNNLKTEITTNGATLGFTPTEIADIVALSTSSIGLIDAHSTAQTAAKAAKAAKDTGVFSNDKKLRAYIKRGKTNSNYTTKLGQQLRIIGEDPIIDYSTYKPTIKATVMPGRVQIDFIKDGLTGVNVYTRLKGETVWVKLAYDSFSPYEDNRRLSDARTPEHREYMAIGVLHDEEITQQSDIIEAVFGG